MEGAPDLDIRASDAERERTVTVLKEHLTDGRLTWEEFSERMEEAYAARTRGALQVVLRELPVPAAPAAASRRPAPPRWRWPVPAVVVVLAVLATVLLGAAAFGDGRPAPVFFPFWPLLFWGFFLARRARRL
jgi:hypothetical protein